MFDIGWAELLVIATVLIVVVGPKDLPAMLRTFGKTVAKLRGMAAEFRGQFDDALREAELDEVRKAVDDVRGLSPRSAINKATQPFREAGNDVRKVLDAATAEADDDEPFDSAVEFDAPHEMEPLDPPALAPGPGPAPQELDKLAAGESRASKGSEGSKGSAGRKSAATRKPAGAKASKAAPGAKAVTGKAVASASAKRKTAPSKKSEAPTRAKGAATGSTADGGVVPKADKTPIKRRRAAKTAETDETTS